MSAPKVFFDKELDLGVYAFEGQVSYSDIQNELTKYYQSAPEKYTKYTLWDFSNADVSKVTNSELRQLGDYVGEAGKSRKGCFDAIVVPSLLGYGLARVFLAYSEVFQKDPDARKNLVFKTREEAYGWMRRNELKNS